MTGVRRLATRVATRAGAVAAAVAVLFATLALVGPPAAQGQESTTSVAPASSLPVGLTLVSQSTWVPLRQAFTMKLHLDNPALAAKPNAAISIQIHSSASSRSGFDEVIQNQLSDSGTLYELNQIRLSTLPLDEHDDFTVSFGLRGSDTSPSVGLNQPGVYPVEVQLVNTDEATRSFITWLVAVDTRSAKPIDQKLSVAMVLPVVASPMKMPDGTDDPKVVAELKPGGRLDKIANLLTHTSGVRMSLVLGPETAQSWKRLGSRNRSMKSSFNAVRAAALDSTTEVLPNTYVPIDAAVLDASGLGRYLPSEYAKSATSLRAALGTDPSASAQSAFVDPVPTTDAVVNGLRQMVIDRVAVRDEALIPVKHQFSPSEAFVLDTTGGESRGVSTAPFVERLFNGPDPAALRAERVIAALAEVAYETPSIPRGIVIAPPQDWNPDLKTMQTVIAALRTLPLVQSATLDDLFGTIANERALGATVQRRLVPAAPAPAPVDTAEYVATASDLEAYKGVVGAKDPVVVQGEAALLTVLSTNITPARAHTTLTQIDSSVHAFASGVQADEKRITLTSRRADIPLSFENNLKPAREVTVRVHLESPKLLFPKGADQLVPLKPGSNTIRFRVEARASGTFPMTISVTSANGQLAFGTPVRVTVRSAVFGGWAVGVTIAALVFLAGWWANHFRRTRRNRRHEAQQAVDPTPAPAT